MSWAKHFAGNELMRSDNIDTTHIAERLAELGGPNDPMKVATEPPQRPEPVQPTLVLDADKQSTPLVDALDKIEASWIAQLAAIRQNSEIIEAKVRACVVSLRQDIARLELLEQQAQKEAERGRKVVRHFAMSLDQIKHNR